MKTSELIAALHDAIKKHGDLPVRIDDPDTGWALEPFVKHGTVDNKQFITISSDYSNTIGDYVVVDVPD